MDQNRKPNADPASSPWFANVVDSGRDELMICIPYAGMGNAIFGGWRDAGFTAADICVAQLPGRDGRLRETPIDNATELVRQICTALIDGPWSDRPLTLLGCSFGALVAYQLARELRRSGIKIERLIAAACRPPHSLGVTEPVASLPDEEMVFHLQHWYGAIPPEVANNPAMLELLLPAIRADMNVYETYQYTNEPPLDCPIVCVGGSEDRIVNLNGLSGWRSETSGKFTCRQFAGDHFFMKSRFAPVLRYIERQMK